MNQLPDPNATVDFPLPPSDPLRSADPFAATDEVSRSTQVEKCLPGANGSASDFPDVTGYRVLRELARGGMGRVLAAHDLSLDREVALKVLLPGVNAERFVRESKITARLPHPGIPPVHALGTLADGSPFLAMKLVAGRTLADEMKHAARPRLLQAFTQVCQAVGFAHSRGVIHRDLKPANVMVGAFGEVQVMDWGLAKESRGEPGAHGYDNVSSTSAARGNAEETQAGTVLGTPSYMAPEQARGEPADAGADVFALGGILCRILSGQPPFTGTSTVAVLQRAAAGDVSEALDRLTVCGADEELISLCRRCLSPRPTDRPADGSAVAGAMTAYLNGVQERLQAAERERAVAEAREAEQRKRRRLMLALAATVLLALGLGVSGWLWVQADRDARTSQANRDTLEAMAQAALAREQAKAATTEAPALFARAREQAQRAAAVVASGLVEVQLQARVRSLVAELDQEEKDNRLLAALEAAQLAQAVTVAGENRFAQESAIPKVRAALEAYGLPVGLADPSAAAEHLRKRPATVQAALVAALDDWVDLASNPAFKINEPDLPWLRAVTMALAPQDDWTRRLRAARLEPDPTKRRTALEQLAVAPEVPRLPAAALERLANLLQVERARTPALQLRRLAQRQHPDDFKANQQLAGALKALTPPQPIQALRYLTAAVALKPDSAGARVNLGRALLEQAESDEAIACLQKAIELDPKYANAHIVLGGAYRVQGKLDQAIGCYRQAIVLDPKDFSAHYNLGNALKAYGQMPEAIRCYRKTIELNPRFAQAHVNLGVELANQGDLDEAITCYERAIECNPKLAPAYANLGLVRAGKGQLEAAVAAYQQALALEPKQPMTYGAMGKAMMGLGRFADARKASEQALALLPPQHPLRKVVDEQILDCDRFLKLEARLPRLLDGKEKASSAQENLDLAQLCHRQRKYAAAVTCFEAAFAAEPNLAANLKSQRRFNAACSAALAAAGRGDNEPPLDEARKTKLRLQALEWLRADLTALTELVDSDQPEAQAFIVETLNHWTTDADLANLREPASLSILPTEERKTLEKFWANVATLCKQAKGK